MKNNPGSFARSCVYHTSFHRESFGSNQRNIQAQHSATREDLERARQRGIEKSRVDRGHVGCRRAGFRLIGLNPAYGALSRDHEVLAFGQAVESVFTTII